MDDDKLKDLFSGFEPELSSSVQFMTKLEKNMEAVEIVKQHNLMLKKRNRQAVLIAAACGFVAGVIFTLLFPLVGDWISIYNISLPYFTISSLTVDYGFLAWLLPAVSCGIISLNAYEIAMAKLPTK